MTFNKGNVPVDVSVKNCEKSDISQQVLDHDTCAQLSWSQQPHQQGGGQAAAVAAEDLVPGLLPPAEQTPGPIPAILSGTSMDTRGGNIGH